MALEHEITATILEEKSWRRMFIEDQTTFDDSQLLAAILRAADEEVWQRLVDEAVDLLFSCLPRLFDSHVIQEFQKPPNYLVCQYVAGLKLSRQSGHSLLEATAVEMHATGADAPTRFSRAFLQSALTRDGAALRLRLVAGFSRRTRLPTSAWLPLLCSWLEALLEAETEAQTQTEAVRLQGEWRRRNEAEGWRDFIADVVQFPGMDTARALAIVEAALDRPSALSFRFFLALVAALTFRGQGAATAMREAVKQRLPRALEAGDAQRAGAALLLAREMGLEAAARQPQFAALSYADWWQVGPASGSSTPSVRAFRSLLKLVWEWLPFESEPLLLRPQVQHPPALPKEQRSAATSGDARVYQDAARVRLTEIRSSESQKK